MVTLNRLRDAATTCKNRQEQAQPHFSPHTDSYQVWGPQNRTSASENCQNLWSLVQILAHSRHCLFDIKTTSRSCRCTEATGTSPSPHQILWNARIKMNELKWRNSHEGIEMKELKWRSVNEGIELKESNERIDMNELKRMNWHEWMDMNELKRMNWHEGVDMKELNWMN